MNQETLDKFLAEFETAKRPERYKLIAQIRSLDEQIYLKEAQLVENRILGLFPVVRKNQWNIHQIEIEGHWWSARINKSSMHIWPENKEYWNRAGEMKVAFGKASDEAVKAKIIKAVRGITTAKVLES